ncbi:DUF3331 domain-containing protein [Pararobbsia silviterrae]|uniref:DUF3331 domain-containing protein n=1 Tax=Pararobbsia silviterrae TaxID=1792498 RepID=A0A494XZ72_9BURK|nr:DUF3331 domain-containing protein [Pararobbsia silviterrae]RKP55854.1 DUF3331 domain-containing protein [Pararobbsia silviterrae]
MLTRLCLITSAAASGSAIGADVGNASLLMQDDHRGREVSERGVTASQARAALSASTDRTVRAAMLRVESALPPATRFVKVLDRPSDRTVTISWRESTLCHYNDQIWRAGIAKHSGTCALTGMHIERGDHVYRPIPTRPTPINANAMILSAAIADQGLDEEGADASQASPRKRGTARAVHDNKGEARIPSVKQALLV